MASQKFGALQALILDMDGVLWKGSELIVDLKTLFMRIEALGLSVTLATNNATLPVEHYLQKFSDHGVSLEAWQITTSALAAAYFLKKRYPDSGPVFVIGESGLVSALEQQGFYQAEEGVVAVVAGLDRTISYEKLRKASILIQNGADFIGTNPDKNLPMPEGLVPVAGALQAVLETTTGIAPTIIGKPQTVMYEQLLERLKVIPQKALVVGDRLDTDIAGAQTIGARSALVLSGSTSRAQAEVWRPSPDLIAVDICAVIDEIG